MAASKDKPFVLPLNDRLRALLRHTSEIEGVSMGTIGQRALGDYFANLGTDPAWQAKLKAHEEKRAKALGFLGLMAGSMDPEAGEDAVATGETPT